jgi:hypothetical protein
MKKCCSQLSTYLKDMAFRKADVSLVCSNKTLDAVPSNLHYYVQKQVQLLSFLSMNKCTVFVIGKVKHYAMKTYGGVDVYTHVFLTLALVGGEWSASHPRRFTPGERAPATYWIGGWVDPRAGLDNMEK